MTQTYKPEPGSIAARVIGHLGSLLPGSMLSNAALAKALNVGNNFTPFLRRAHEHGLLAREVREGQIHWGLPQERLRVLAGPPAVNADDDELADDDFAVRTLPLDSAAWIPPLDGVRIDDPAPESRPEPERGKEWPFPRPAETAQAGAPPKGALREAKGPFAPKPLGWLAPPSPAPAPQSPTEAATASQRPATVTETAQRGAVAGAGDDANCDGGESLPPEDTRDTAQEALQTGKADTPAPGQREVAPQADDDAVEPDGLDCCNDDETAARWRATLADLDRGVAAPSAADPNEYTEGRDSQQVLKAEALGPDATDRETPANASPDGGPTGAGQPAAAGPVGEQEPTAAPAPRVHESALVVVQGDMVVQAPPAAPRRAGAARAPRAATAPACDNSTAAARPVRYALWSDGRLVIDRVGDKLVELSTEETRELFHYLDRMAVGEGAEC